ncbi:MAG: phage major capsid protein [Bacteroidaceae bacterium]|nr:phage major capsid protein [Bacteroidaceae bacterium]
MGKTKAEIQKRHQAILVELDQIEELAARENRPFTKEENDKYDALMREDNRLHIEIQGMLDEHQLSQFREMKSKSQKLRELLKKVKENRESYSEELTVREEGPNNSTTVLKDKIASGTYQNANANIEASGAVPLTIHELIDTKIAGLELPDDLRLLTGVVGNEIWPYSIDDVEFTVAGEVEPIGEQAINFAKLSATPARVAASVAVSNRAIDNAAFDLLGFVTYKFQKGLAKFAALHVYSHADFQNPLKSPFASLVAEEIALDENFGKNLAKKIAAMWDLGFEGEPELVMSKEVETELAFTKAIPGQIGDRTVIQDGRCLGYRYKVSPYVNYALNTADVPAPDGNLYIGIGHWGYLAYEQHGEVRFTVDAQSAEVAKRNSTVLVLNTEFSLTELSSKVNGNLSGLPQAFKLIKVVEPEPTTV